MMQQDLLDLARGGDLESLVALLQEELETRSISLFLYP
jgi:hypothetical protein